MSFTGDKPPYCAIHDSLFCTDPTQRDWNQMGQLHEQQLKAWLSVLFLITFEFHSCILSSGLTDEARSRAAAHPGARRKSVRRDGFEQAEHTQNQVSPRDTHT